MQRTERMLFRSNFLRRYLEIAPAALAIERTLECEILSSCRFDRPILDVGCGDGVFAAILCGERIDTGIDSSAAEIERAKRHNCYNELIVCSGACVPKPDGTYRTIFSNSVLEHIPDIKPVLRELRRLLATGGRLYVTIPTDWWEKSVFPARVLHAVGLHELGERYARFYNRFWHQYHALPETCWTALFAEAGFTVRAAQHYAPPNMTSLLDILTPAAGPAMVSKRLLGRWIALPHLRKTLIPILYPVIAALTAFCRRQSGGTLLFLALSPS